MKNLFSESSFDSLDDDVFKKKERQTSWVCILLTTGKGAGSADKK